MPPRQYPELELFQILEDFCCFEKGEVIDGYQRRGYIEIYLDDGVSLKFNNSIAAKYLIPYQSSTTILDSIRRSLSDIQTSIQKIV